MKTKTILMLAVAALTVTSWAIPEPFVLLCTEDGLEDACWQDSEPANRSIPASPDTVWVEVYGTGPAKGWYGLECELTCWAQAFLEDPMGGFAYLGSVPEDNSAMVQYVTIGGGGEVLYMPEKHEELNLIAPHIYQNLTGKWLRGTFFSMGYHVIAKRHWEFRVVPLSEAMAYSASLGS